MKKLHLLVIKSFLGPLVLTFFFVVFILLMQFLWKYIDDLIGKGLEFSVIGEFLVYTAATLVPLAMPLAVLLASLMTFGNMAENLELLAAKSSGVSLVKIMSPVAVLSVLIAIGAFLFSNHILPYSNLKMRSLLYDIQQQRPELTIRPGIFDNTLEGYSIRIGERDSRTSLLTDILIFDHTDNHGNVSVIMADSGYMKMSNDEKHLLLSLYNGSSYLEMQKQKKESRNVKSYPLRRDYFGHREMLIEMTGFGLNRSDEKLFRNSYSMLNLEQLHHFDDSLSMDLEGVCDKFFNTLDQTLTGKSKTILLAPKSRVRKDTVRKDSVRQDTVRKDSVRQDTVRKDSVTLAAAGKQIVPVEEKIQEGPRILALHVDSAFADLNQLEARRAISQALNFARSSKSVVTSNVGTVEWKTSRLRRYQIEIHRKFTLSLLCLIFFFIGAPLGAIIRKGGLGMPVIVSVLLFLVYYIIAMIGEKFVRESILHPSFGMWISTFILIPVSIWLTYKAARDSVILNIETYFTWFKKSSARIRKFFGRS